MWLFAALSRDADDEARRGFRRATAAMLGGVITIICLVAFGIQNLAHVRH